MVIWQVLRPSCQLRHLLFWSSVYLHSTAPTEAGLDDAHEMSASMDPEDLINQSELKKTKSCDDIVAALEHTSTMTTRRLSDPSVMGDIHLEGGFIKQQPQPLKDELLSNEEREGDLSMGMNGSDKVGFVNNTSSATTLVNGNDDEGVEAFSEDEDVIEKSRCENDEAVVTNGILTNGHHTLDDNETEDDITAVYNKENERRSQSGISEKTSAINKGTDGNSTRSVLSSTDTLTEDLAILELKTGVRNSQNGSELAHQEVLNSVSKGQRSGISMSTSTSDISDSHVKLNGLESQPSRHSKLDETLMNLHLVSGLRTYSNGRVQGQSDLHLYNPSSKVSMSSTDTENSSPSYYRTPSSTCPPTPGTDAKV